MIAEIIPEAYDATGKKVFRPDLRRRGFHPTFPMGRYVSQPVAITCKNFRDIRDFLMTCRYVSDEELFGKEDYWQPPEDFERLRKGDCDDFALWTWRQLIELGYDARIVFGRHGRYGTGHAWVSFAKDGKQFLVEPQYRWVGNTFPRLTTLRYQPRISAAWDGSKISFFSHQARKFNPTMETILPLLTEWFFTWIPYWASAIIKLPYALIRFAYRKTLTWTK